MLDSASQKLFDESLTRHQTRIKNYKALLPDSGKLTACTMDLGAEPVQWHVSNLPPFIMSLRPPVSEAAHV